METFLSPSQITNYVKLEDTMGPLKRQQQRSKPIIQFGGSFIEGKKAQKNAYNFCHKNHGQRTRFRWGRFHPKVMPCRDIWPGVPNERIDPIDARNRCVCFRGGSISNCIQWVNKCNFIEARFSFDFWAVE